MPDKAPDFLVAGCWEKPQLGTEGLQWHWLKWADNLGQLSGNWGGKDEWVMGEQS